MALTPADIDSFIAALHNDAALRKRVRAVVLSEELLTLPQRMAEAHADHERRTDELEARIRELDARLTARLDGLTERMDTLTEAWIP